MAQRRFPTSVILGIVARADHLVHRVPGARCAPRSCRSSRRWWRSVWASSIITVLTQPPSRDRELGARGRHYRGARRGRGLRAVASSAGDRNGLISPGRDARGFFAVTALNTPGRAAVPPRRSTVCVALLGLFALQISSLYGVAVAVRARGRPDHGGVADPAGPAYAGLSGAWKGCGEPSAGCRRERGRQARAGGRRLPAPLGRRVSAAGRRSPPSSRWWHRPSCSPSCSSAPRTGLLDASTDPSSSTTYQALLSSRAEGISCGLGFNGPLEVVGQINSPADQTRFAAFLTSAGPQRARRGGGHSATAQPER